MTSFVYYKFKSQRDESRIAFDGTGISVFDLKREIIIAKALEKANDFDVVLLDPSTEQEYDDAHMIPRSSSVIVKRVPVRAGRSKIPNYLAGASLPSSRHQNGNTRGSSGTPYIGPMSKRFDGKEEPQVEKKLAPIPNSSIQSDEAAALEAMFSAEADNWNATQEKMSQQTRIYTAPRHGNRKLGGNTAGQRDHKNGETGSRDTRFHPYVDRPERPIPQGYVCFRCGQKGHWIQDCPTNQDKEWDHKPRLKRTTGIPRSFLKTVEQAGDGVMITPEGKLVVAQPDNASWEKQITKSKYLNESDIRERPVTDSTLVCPLDSLLFRDAVRTPCCSTTYCEECIQTCLLENDFVCPKCHSKISSLDKLVMDKPMRTRVMDYIDKAIAESVVESDETDLLKTQKRQLTPSADDTANDQVSFNEQPGGDGVQDLTTEQDGYQENQTFEQLQAEIQQLQTMLSNPRLPVHARNQASVQLMQKQTLLSQAQTMSMLISQAQAASATDQSLGLTAPLMNPAAMFNPMMVQQPNLNYNYNQAMYPQGGYWSNDNQLTTQQGSNQSYHSQPPSREDSPYQRLPVNNRRKPLRRERPSDFVEIQGQAGYQY